MVMKILTAINIIGLLQSKRRPHHKRASLTLEARLRPQGVRGQGRGQLLLRGIAFFWPRLVREPALAFGTNGGQACKK
jgi:hypothetical protein